MVSTYIKNAVGKHASGASKSNSLKLHNHPWSSSNRKNPVFVNDRFLKIKEEGECALLYKEVT